MPSLSPTHLVRYYYRALSNVNWRELRVVPPRDGLAELQLRRCAQQPVDSPFGSTSSDSADTDTDTDHQDAVIGDAADKTGTDEPDDLPEARGPAVSVAHAAERLITSQMEAQQAKLALFRAFCTAFDQTAVQFTSGHAFNFAKGFSRGFLSVLFILLSGLFIEETSISAHMPLASS